MLVDDIEKNSICTMKRRGTRVTTALIIGLTTVIPVSMMDSSLAPSLLHLASKI